MTFKFESAELKGVNAWTTQDESIYRRKHACYPDGWVKRMNKDFFAAWVGETLLGIFPTLENAQTAVNLQYEIYEFYNKELNEISYRMPSFI